MSTPPPQQQQEPATPEQVRKRELNRLKAKERQRQWLAKQADSQQTAWSSNANGKRPMVQTPAGPPRVERDGAKAVSQQAQAPKPLPRDTRLIGKYVEYDLSKMVNRKGGFLLEDGKEVDEEVRRKERQREQERMRQNVEPPVLLGASDTQPICRECGSIHIDSTFQRVFGCLVCNKCKDEKPEKYSLLTKTECKEDYLLTDPELRDHELLPHLLKANPHSSTWNNMMLFLRFQVEEYAFNVKWGSPEALDAEFEKRVAYKKAARQKKFDKGLQELRKRTKESIWQQRRDEEHVHEYGVIEKTGNGGEGVQRCMTCGFEVEVEEM